MRTKKPSKVKVIPYEEYLLKDLSDSVYAAGYLTAALEEGEEVFLLAVRNVVKAQGGMQSLSRGTGLNRESLYTMLSDHGNPMFSSVRKVLDGLGFRVQVAPKLRGSRAA